jgi:nicotinate dehydrogenase subunit A
MTTPITLRINGCDRQVHAGPDVPLLTVLHEDLGLFGARFGCGAGECGACVVLLDGEPVPSCTLPVGQAAGRSVLTIEGLSHGERLHPLQDAFVATGALQCGFCTSGILLAALALLRRNRSPTDDQIRNALARHLCRCGTYGRVVEAVRRAAAGGAQE